MLKNLLKTWEILAPDELRCDEARRVWLPCIDEYSASLHISPLSDGSLLPFEKSLLQGCIQQCIESRGWGWKLCKHFPRTSACIYLSESHLGGQHFIEDSAIEALLTAYLTALAAQRPITQGQWRHFKGGEIKVESTATWTTHKIHEFLGDNAFIEESPEKKIQVHLSIVDYDAPRWGYRASKDYGERVIYVEQNGKRWARKSDIFLGLVGTNQEHEGLLRFVEVAE